jgi:hypothetical protein
MQLSQLLSELDGPEDPEDEVTVQRNRKTNCRSIGEQVSKKVA